MSLLNNIKKAMKKTSCGCTKKNRRRTYRGGYEYNRTAGRTSKRTTRRRNYH